MSLQTRLSALITAIGADIKKLRGSTSVASTATLTPGGTEHQLCITAQAVALAIANPSAGAFSGGQRLIIRIKDNGTARAISWGTNYRAVGVTLPTTTVVNKTLYIGLIWNDTDTKFDVLAIGQEA